MKTGGLAVLTLVLCFAMGATARGVGETFAVFLLPISESFGWARAEATSVYAVLMLSLGLGSPVAGRMFDRLGPGRLFTVGAACLAAGPALASMATSLWQFYFCLGVLVGFGGAALGSAVQSALLARWYTRSLTTAVAVVAGAAGFGIMGFSPLSQMLIDGFGWRDAYLGLAGGIACLLVVIAAMPWRRIAAGREPAVPRSPGGAPAMAEVAWSFARAVRSRPFWALFFVHFLTASAMFAINPQIVAFLVEHGFDPVTAATAFGIAGIAATVGQIGFGIIADRLGALVSITLSYGLTIAGFLMLLPLAHAPSFWLLALFVAVYGPSFGSRGPVISALTARLFGRGRDLGLIMGAVFTGMGTGAAVGSTAGGLIHDLSGGYTYVVAWSLAAVIVPPLIFWTVPELRAVGMRRGR